MKLTTEQFNILAHVVEDPQAWADHLEQSKVSDDALDAKVEKYRASYEAEKDKPDYKTRLQREDDVRASDAAATEARLTAKQEAETTRKAEIQSMIDETLARK